MSGRPPRYVAAPGAPCFPASPGALGARAGPHTRARAPREWWKKVREAAGAVAGPRLLVQRAVLSRRHTAALQACVTVRRPVPPVPRELPPLAQHGLASPGNTPAGNHEGHAGCPAPGGRRPCAAGVCRCCRAAVAGTVGPGACAPCLPLFPMLLLTQSCTIQAHAGTWLAGVVAGREPVDGGCACTSRWAAAYLPAVPRGWQWALPCTQGPPQVPPTPCMPHAMRPCQHLEHSMHLPPGAATQARHGCRGMDCGCWEACRRA